MTAEFTECRDINSLIKASQHTFYPVSIPPQHYQLKHYISTKDANVIYYASGHEVSVLHPKTRKRELIKSLPWEVQCLDAAHGWIGVGGPDKGRCAFISIDGVEAERSSSRQYAEVDDALSLELDPESRVSAYRGYQSLQLSRRSAPKYELHEVELGEMIVNSVTIHVMHSNQKGLEDEVVAILTNNDKIIRIFSLTQFRVLTTLDFSCAMNHATLSPDGTLLIAVGDEPRAFFYKRVRMPDDAVIGAKSFATYEWHKVAEPKLSLAESEDYCFSTAFSPSGHMCAAATQSGAVTVFDTNAIVDDMDADHAVIAIFKSSRPNVPPGSCGAVRSMSFSPAPWDLLAWAEDQSRACVIDLRNAFNSRQTIDLKVDSQNTVTTNVEDQQNFSAQRQLEIEERFLERQREALEARNHLAAVSHQAEYMEHAAERRRLERESLNSEVQALRHSEPGDLTNGERQMIDSIGLRRLQSNDLEISRSSSTALPTAPLSITYTPSSSNRHAEPSTWLSSPTSLSSFQGRSTASITDYMRQRNLERSRANDRSYQPRRRSSVVISNSNPTSNSSAHPSSLAPIGTAAPTISASPSRLASSNTTDTTAPASSVFATPNPWDTITEAIGVTSQDLHRIRSESGRRVESIQQMNSQQQQALALLAARNERQQATNVQRLRQMHTALDRSDVVYDETLIALRRVDGSRARRDEGLTTMGIGWSVEGRYMYVATEEGIIEYAVNIEERMQFPAKSFL